MKVKLYSKLDSKLSQPQRTGLPMALSDQLLTKDLAEAATLSLLLQLWKVLYSFNMENNRHFLTNNYLIVLLLTVTLVAVVVL